MPSATEAPEITTSSRERDMSPKACVTRGSQLLPANWFMIVDPDTLDASSCENCPAAQAYASEARAQGRCCGWAVAMDTLALSTLGTQECGFFANDDNDYLALTAAWKDEILRLRALAA